MSSRIARLITSYQRYIELPWQDGLAGPQKVIFVVYDRNDEARLRFNVEEFELATISANHDWQLIDITDAFPEWMVQQEYKEGYFEYPEDLEDILGDFTDTVVTRITNVLEASDPNTVVAVQGVAGLFGFARCSEVVSRVASSIKGRILVFFPGEYENNNYRLLNARPGWNYQAVPITASDTL